MSHDIAYIKRLIREARTKVQVARDVAATMPLMARVTCLVDAAKLRDLAAELTAELDGVTRTT